MTQEETRLAVIEQPPQTVAVVLWGTNEPAGMVARMGEVASALGDAIRERGMSKRMSDRQGAKEYVFAEGWALAGSIIGIFPRTVALDEVRGQDGDLYGYQATVRLVTRDGDCVGESMAMCTRDEERWEGRDWNQIASMAQTRATGKAFRATLGFVMSMAGYAPTPAEEMEGSEREAHPPRRPVDAQQRGEAWGGERQTAEKRNGVTEPPVVNSIGSLISWAQFHWNLRAPDLLLAFGVEATPDIRTAVDALGGWDEACAKLRAMQSGSADAPTPAEAEAIVAALPAPEPAGRRA